MTVQGVAGRTSSARAVAPGRIRGRAAVFLLAVVGRFVVLSWLVATATFFVVRGLPGNPVDVYIQDLISRGKSPAAAEAQASAFLRIDLSEPLGNQYVQFMSNLLHGDLGASTVISPGTPVTELIAGRLPWTLISVGGALVVSFFIGLRLGAAAASRRGRFIDHAITNVSTVIDAIPAILLAILAVFVLAVAWPIVPLSQLRGAYAADLQPGWDIDFIVSAFTHLLVPGLIYVLSSVGGWTLAMRSSCVSIIGDDYVTQAKARGLTSRRIQNVYVGRNARLPLVTGFAISVGFVISGSVLIEQIFVYPGVGQLLNTAIGLRDYSVMQGVVIVTTVAVLITTAIADALYGFLDPRVRIPTEGGS